MPLQLANTSSVTPAIEENEALKATLKVVYKNLTIVLFASPHKFHPYCKQNKQ
jgi:peroxiredoxin